MIKRTDAISVINSDTADGLAGDLVGVDVRRRLRLSETGWQ
ncbi:MAG: hypothetical protein ACOYNZ_08505 [Rhodoferax sp.]